MCRVCVVCVWVFVYMCLCVCISVCMRKGSSESRVGEGLRGTGLEDAGGLHFTMTHLGLSCELLDHSRGPINPSALPIESENCINSVAHA